MSWFVPAFDLWLHVTIAGLALTAAASLAVLLLREPARKIRVIQLALLGLLVLPALVLLPGYPRVTWRPASTTPAPQPRQPLALPGGSSAASPASDTFTAAAPSDPAPQPPALPAGSSPPPRENTSGAASAPIVASQPAPPSAAPITATVPVPAPAESTLTNPPSVAQPTAPGGFSLPTIPDYRVFILSLYLLGVALLALWWMIGRIALWRVLRTATPAEPHLRAILDDIAKDHAAKSSRVRLLVSPRAAQPCAFGVLRPTIVLPERVVRELTREQLRLALSHEWSHVAGGDIRTWMLAGVVRLVHFHQPLVWLLRRELRLSQDYLADAAAAGTSNPEDYAELLTTLSRILRPTPLSPGLGIAPRRSELYRRVVMLVDHTRPLERTIPRRWNLAAIALGLALIAGAATLRAEPEVPESKQAEMPAIDASSDDRQKDQESDRLQFEKDVAKLRDDIAGLQMAREFYRQEAAKQLLNKERERIEKQIPPLDKQIAELEKQLDERWQQLVRPLAGQVPPENPYVEKVPADRSAQSPTTLEPKENPGSNYLGLKLFTVGRELETLLETRKQLDLMLRHDDSTSQQREKIETQLRMIDEACIDHSRTLLSLERQLRDVSTHAMANAVAPGDASDPASATNWEKSGETRRRLDALFSELDQLLKARDAMLKRAAKQTSSQAKTPLEAQIRQLDQKRFEIAQRIDSLLQPSATGRPTSVALSPPAVAAPPATADEPAQTPAAQAVDAQATQPAGTGIMSPEHQQELNDLIRLRKELERHASKETSEAGKQKIEARLRELDEKLKHLAVQTNELLDERRQASLDKLLEGDLKQAVASLGSKPSTGGENTAQAGQAAPPRAALISRKVANTPRTTPFSGRIRVGDILGMEMTGGFPTPPPPPRTVEPDGNLVLGAVYGPASRVKVAGMTLIEAGQTIEKQLKEILKAPHVLLTYEGHNDGVVPEGTPVETTTTAGKPAPAVEPGAVSNGKPVPGAEPIVLKPLDTIEVILPLSKSQVWISQSDGTRKEKFGLGRPEISGLYLLEPDGRIALPQAGGRVKLAGLTELQASEALRNHLAVSLFPRSALPTARVIRRGHAVFPEGKQPPPDYRIQPGDSLLMGYGQRTALNTPVDSDGNLLADVQIPVGGMTLEEADAAIRQKLRPPVKNQPYDVITLGGWREEADPRVIDLIEGTDATQLLRMQEEMQELKTMIGRLRAE